jgi:hypothetical protein
LGSRRRGEVAGVTAKDVRSAKDGDHGISRVRSKGGMLVDGSAVKAKPDNQHAILQFPTHLNFLSIVVF